MFIEMVHHRIFRFHQQHKTCESTLILFIWCPRCLQSCIYTNICTYKNYKLSTNTTLLHVSEKSPSSRCQYKGAHNTSTWILHYNVKTFLTICVKFMYWYYVFLCNDILRMAISLKHAGELCLWITCNFITCVCWHDVSQMFIVLSC